MRIAILVANLAMYSGDARVAQPQAEQLADQGHDVAIFCLDGDIEPQRAALFKMGMPRSPAWRRLYRLLLPLDIPKVIRWLPRLKQHDLIISHPYPMTWFACWAKMLHGVSYTFWYHGLPGPEYFPKLHEKIYMKAAILLTRFTTWNADRVVSVSQFARREFKEYTGRDSEVQYNSVDSRRFHPGLDGRRVREKLDLGDAPVVLSVGRITPFKGFHLLIEALKLVKQELPYARLVIVGALEQDYYSKRLREMSDRSVIFAGYVGDDAPHYYAMCDVYATCSLWETFNLPLMEAQACGKPAVAFDIGAHREVAGANTRLVEKGDIVSFARACCSILT